VQAFFWSKFAILNHVGNEAKYRPHGQGALPEWEETGHEITGSLLVVNGKVCAESIEDIYQFGS